MRRMLIAGLATGIILTAVGTATASDRNATAAIVTGDYAHAEKVLLAERRIFPGRPELMLNLATIYRRTGRQEAAQALYAAVLRRPDVLLDVTDGQTLSAHALAQAALAQTEVAAR